MKPILSLTDVRLELGGVSRWTVRNLVKAGKLAPGRVFIPGGRPRWRRADVEAALAGMQEEQPKVRRSA